jgi:hypothetical protein
MKHIINMSLLTIMILCSNCSDKITENVINQELPEIISVNELRSLLHTKLQTSGDKYAIYKDDNLIEHRIKISVNLDIQNLRHGTEKYKAETHTIDFNDTNDNKVDVRFVLNSNVYGEDKIQKSQSILVGYFERSNPLGILIPYDYEANKISKLSSKKLATIDLRNKIFNNVYISDDTVNNFNKELRFNFENGVVSFINSSGKLLIFDKFED